VDQFQNVYRTAVAHVLQSWILTTAVRRTSCVTESSLSSLGQVNSLFIYTVSAATFSFKSC